MAMDLTITIKAINQASAAIGQVLGQVEKLKGAGGKAKALGQSISGFGKAASMKATLPIAGALGFAAKSAIEFESSMANVAKLANLDSKQTKVMGDQLLTMSRTMPISASGLAEIAASGASLGIATKDLKGFVDVTAKMATSFDMTADQAGNAIAKLRNVYSLDAKGGVKQTEMLGDVINALGDNTAAREADIVNAMTRIGGASRNFGFSAKQAAALSAAVISMGNAPEVAATAINSWLPSLQTASKQTPKFQAALKSMGMDAKQLERDIGQDAPKAFQKFVGAIGKLKPAARAAALRDMFGTGSDASILSAMANDTKQLANAFKMAEQTKPGGMLETFKKNSATTANQMQLLKNNVAEVGITLGSAMLPAINGVMNALKPLVTGIADFAKANPGITQMAVGFAAIVAAVGPAAIAIGAMVSAIGSIGTGIAAIKSLGVAMGAMKGAGAIAALKGFGAAVAPAAALAGILGGVAYGVVQVGAKLAGTEVSFQDFTNTITSSLSELPSNLAQLPGAIGAIFSAIVTQARMHFVNLGLTIKMAFLQAKTAVMAGITSMMTLFTAMGTQLQTVFTTIGAMITGAFAQVQAVFMSAGMAIQAVFMQIVMSVQMAVQQIVMVFAMIGAQIQAAIASIMATLASLGAQIAAVFSSMTAAVTSAMSQVVSAITSGMASAVAAVQSAGAGMVGAITGVAGQMFAAGQSIIQQLISGIQSMAGAAMSAISSIASQIRGAMPFSPAKWGPLSDIDKTGYGLMSTFAAGITANPVIKPLTSALTPVAGMLSAPMGTPQVGGAMPTGGMGGMGGGINLTYSPNINMGAGEGQDIRAMLQENAKELVQLLQNEQRRLERTQYVPGGSII